MILASRRRILGLIVAAGIPAAVAACAKEQPAAVGGPFQLVDQNGQAVDEKILKGRWSAVFFGFTYCPDICPATLQALAMAKSRLGSRADKLQIVLISVDPARDTPAALRAYLDSPGFDKDTIGLTGTPEQVAAAAKAYRAYFKKAGDGPGYQMQHTSAVYLMNPKGRFARVLAYGLSPDEMARQIKDAMAGR